MKHCEDVNLTDKFPLVGKIVTGIAFYGVIIIGLYVIFQESIAWGLGYTAFLIFGFVVLFGYGVCAHCPYPYKYSDCFFPPFGQLVAKMYKFRPEPFNVIDKIGFFIIMGGMVVIPQYWLFKNYAMLVVFWILCVFMVALLQFYGCRRCRNFTCPFNTVKEKP